MAITQQDEQKLTQIAQQYINGKQLTPPDPGAPAEAYPDTQQDPEAAAQTAKMNYIANKLYNHHLPNELSQLIDDDALATQDSTNARISELELAYKRISTQLSNQQSSGMKAAQSMNAADARRRSIPNPWA